MNDQNLNQFDGGLGGGDNSSGDKGNGGGPSKNPKKQNIILFVIAALISLLLVSAFMNFMTGSSEREISYNEFIQMLDENKVASVTIDSDRIYIQPKVEQSQQNPLMNLYGMSSSVTFYTGKIEDNDTLTNRLLEHSDVEVKGKVADGSGAILGFLLTYVFPFLLMWVLLSFLFRKMSKGGGPMGVGKSNAKVYVQKETGITFKDVAGEDEAKESLQEVVDFLHNPMKYASIGAKLPKGALLVGPPGTGKTLLAKAVAGEAKVPFFSLSGSDFIELYVGVGASRVRDLFKEATKNAPCIIFIDEIDAIGRRRTEEAFHDGRQEILNALLTEMDGFKTSVKKPVLVMAATNLGGNNGSTGALDPALVRRFDRSICIDLPDRAGRIQLLKMLRNKHQILRISDDMLQNLAERSIGMSPALLEGAVNAAIREAIRSGTEVSDSMMDEAFEKYNHGEEKHWNRADLIKTARHEAGHAVVCNYFGEEPSYLTVAARDNHGGYMMYSAAEGKGVYTKKELLRQIAVSLGGRAAELVYYGEEEGLSTGPSSDLETATAIARKMICNYGMYNEIAAGIVMQNEVSETVSQSIEQKVNAIIQEQLNLSVAIIKENADKMAQLVDTLMEKTHLNKQEIQEVLND